MATRIKKKAAKRAANKDTRPTAVVRYVRMSPFKVRQVLDVVRGKTYPEAVAILTHIDRIAAPVILKLINSAAANAEHKAALENYNLDRAALYVAEIYADQGPTLKRVMPRAKGSASRILKRTSHITVKLDEKAE